VSSSPLWASSSKGVSSVVVDSLVLVFQFSVIVVVVEGSVDEKWKDSSPSSFLSILGNKEVTMNVVEEGDDVVIFSDTVSTGFSEVDSEVNSEVEVDSEVEVEA